MLINRSKCVEWCSLLEEEPFPALAVVQDLADLSSVSDRPKLLLELNQSTAEQGNAEDTVYDLSWNTVDNL